MFLRRCWNVEVAKSKIMANKIFILRKSDAILLIGGLAESKSEDKIAKFKMAEPIRQSKFLFFTNKTLFYLGVFWGAKSKSEQNWEIKNGGCNMAAIIFIFCKSEIFLPIRVFWGAECEYEDKIAKFKMANSIWRSKL